MDSDAVLAQVRQLLQRSGRVSYRALRLRFQLDDEGLAARGEWNGIRFTASLRLAASTPAWFWHVILENAGHAAATVDLIYAQDVALAHYGLVRLQDYRGMR